MVAAHECKKILDEYDKMNMLNLDTLFRRDFLLVHLLMLVKYYFVLIRKGGNASQTPFKKNFFGETEQVFDPPVKLKASFRQSFFLIRFDIARKLTV